jgi:ribosome-binding protein aMBF1 (putative translation factor)
MITPAECKEARRLLGWSQRDLAKRLGIGVRSVAVFETGERLPWPLDQRELEDVFGAARMEFTNGAASGVRLRLAGAVIRATWDPPEQPE